MSRVLLVDDDVELCQMLAEYLAPEGFEVDMVHDGAEGERRALEGNYDVIVLDIMLPIRNGLETLQQIRRATRTPVLMLTAKGDDVDRIIGLELGADDYLPKPCNPRELVARLRAILRRTGAGTDDRSAVGPVQVGDLTVRSSDRTVLWHGEALELTSTEFNLLETLARAAGRVVTKNELSEQGLGRPLARYDRSIDMHVSNLRRKLGDLRDGRSPIQTVRGVGYQLIAG
jgi:two-component system OmpR family response regulator